jgi:hypothetical protein
MLARLGVPRARRRRRRRLSLSRARVMMRDDDYKIVRERSVDVR